MVHGPCGTMKPNAICMIKNQCSKHYPKKFQPRTLLPEDGVPLYRRRNQSKAILLDVKSGFEIDNRYIVPHNRNLLVKYQSHINVEICNKARSIKYLFKYLSKGPDRIRVTIE